MTRHKRIIQIMPDKGEFIYAILYEDGSVGREAIVGWSLIESWYCPRENCRWQHCHSLEAHSELDSEVEPLVFIEWDWVGPPLASNAWVVPVATSDDEVRSLAAQEQS